MMAERTESRRILLVDNAGTPIPYGGSVLDFLMNFVTYSGTTGVDDGKDTIFGDAGDDWIVGGTNHDRMWGGWGDDYLQADDDLNSTPDDPSDPYVVYLAENWKGLPSAMPWLSIWTSPDASLRMFVRP